MDRTAAGEGYDRREQGAGDAGTGTVEALWRYRWSSLALVGAVLLAAVALSLLAAPGPTATAAVGLKDPRGAAYQGQPASSDVQSRFVSDQAALAGSDEVLAAAAAALGGADVDDLRGRVDATGDPEANVVLISATADSLAQARRTADAVVEGFRATSRALVEEQTGAARDALAQTRADALAAAPTSAAAQAALAETVAGLDEQLADVTVYAETYGDGVRYVNPAAAASPGPLEQPWLRAGVVGLAAGLLLASVVAVLRTTRALRPRTGSTGSAASTGSTASTGGTGVAGADLRAPGAQRAPREPVGPLVAGERQP
jgi:capsular polysaccharide biosynthesis protein